MRHPCSSESLRVLFTFLLLLPTFAAFVSNEKSEKAAGGGCPKCHSRRGRKTKERTGKLSHYYRSYFSQSCSRAKPI